jgi:MFS family permease
VFIGVFAMWRFLLGIGIGGDYPLSAVITSEYTPRHLRGAMMAAVFAMQVGAGCWRGQEEAEEARPGD